MVSVIRCGCRSWLHGKADIAVPSADARVRPKATIYCLGAIAKRNAARRLLSFIELRGLFLDVFDERAQLGMNLGALRMLQVNARTGHGERIEELQASRFSVLPLIASSGP